MSNYIVLVKQVPDVSQITDNAFDPETGTLVRTRLASVINELDAQALAFANKMRQDSAPAAFCPPPRLVSIDAGAGESRSGGKIIALSMGPPMAEQVLRYSLSRCADIVILLTDRALGGADTVATANPLAFAIRKIVKEIFKEDSDYYVITGMQSVDGDTAQVPAQIAEELNLPCIAYVTDAEFKNNRPACPEYPTQEKALPKDGTAGRFEFTRIISGGSQMVAVKKLPAVITVAKYEYPLFAAFSRTRWANKTKVIRWSATDINATHIGVTGSKTSVIRVFPPGKSTRKCQQINNAESLAKVLVESFKSGNGGTRDEGSPLSRGQACPCGGRGTKDERYILPGKRASLFDRNFEGTKKEQEDYEILTEKLKALGITRINQIDDAAREKILEAAGEHFHKKALEDMIEGFKLAKPSFEGEVWVVAETSSGVVHPATFELTGRARELADSLETKVGVVIAGHNIEAMSKELIAAGADNIYIIEDKLLEVFDPTAYRKAIADAISTYWPQIVLYAATPQGRMLAPMVSYRVSCGLTADCTGLDIRDSSRKGDIGLLLQTRPALGGNVMATIRTKNSKSQMATARPGVMKRIPPDPSRKGKIIRHKVKLTEDDVSLEIIKTELGSGEVNFNADVIVSGGKGMQSRDNYEHLLGLLCDALNKKLDKQVERGASRAAVEQGFIERVHQVGQTGTSIGPKLYVALGISGAIQHMIGVANTETIVAINSDPNAPIFKQCDYYIVGTVEDAVPKLVEALESQ
jgi:electron transfer flavoprotein alpha subunit